MALPISELVGFLRTMADDNYVDLQEYTDLQLSDQYLRIAVILENAEWEQGYSVQLNINDSNNNFYEISPTPPEWMQILYVTRAALGMREWKETFSIDNKVIKKTSSNIKDVVDGLRMTRAAILQERKFGSVGYSFSNWDDFFTRPQLTFDAINQGYR